MSLNIDAIWAGRAAKAVLLIRVLVGWVFLSEGIQKFLFPDSLGVGRFVKIGIPWPQVNGSVCWCRRDRLRSLAVDRPDDAACLHPASDRYMRGVVLDQDRHACQERALEHIARSPHRREHVTRFDFSAVGGRRYLVSRCTVVSKRVNHNRDLTMR